MEFQGAMFSVKTNNWGAMFAYYQRLLGRPKRLKEGASAFFDAGGVPLVLWHNTGDNGPTGPGSVELTLTVADLDLALKELPASISTAPIVEASHGRECFLHDPDGNRLILYSAN